MLTIVIGLNEYSILRNGASSSSGLYPLKTTHPHVVVERVLISELRPMITFLLLVDVRHHHQIVLVVHLSGIRWQFYLLGAIKRSSFFFESKL